MPGNQYIADPRQSLFLAAYLDPKKKTFSNAYKSAIEAGYEDEYAKVILSKGLDWLSESVKDEDMVRKAEEALIEALEYETKVEGKVDAGVGRLKLDATKLVLKGLMKDKYSERTEQTGKDGSPLHQETLTKEQKLKLDQLLDE